MQEIAAANHSTLQIVQAPLSDTDLGAPSLVTLPIDPSRVASALRSGEDLVLTLRTGEQLRLGHFFAVDPDGVAHALAFEDDHGALWQAGYSHENFDGFDFSAASDEDEALLAATGGESLEQVATVAASAAEAPPTALPSEASPPAVDVTEVLADQASPADGTPPSTEPAATGWSSLPVWAQFGLGLLGAGGAVAAFSGGGGGGGSSRADSTPPTAPSDLALSVDGTSLSGRGEAGALVTLYGVDGRVLGTGTVDADGHFLIHVSMAPRAGETWRVILADASGNLSPEVPVVGSVGQLSVGEAGSDAFTPAEAPAPAAAVALSELVTLADEGGVRPLAQVNALRALGQARPESAHTATSKGGFDYLPYSGIEDQSQYLWVESAMSPV